MVRGIYVEPDKGISRVRQTARFTVPADMPESHVRAEAREIAKQWMRDFAARGYTLDSRIYLYPTRYAHIELPDDGSVGGGVAEHDPAKQEVVDRCMTAFWRVRDIVIPALPETEKAMIRRHVHEELRRTR